MTPTTHSEAVGHIIEAIEEERVRLWNEVRDLRASLNVEKAATDTMRIERDSAWNDAIEAAADTAKNDAFPAWRESILRLKRPRSGS